MGKEKAIIDTNVIISAIGWDGVPERALHSLYGREISLILSDVQEREVHRVLANVRMPSPLRGRPEEILEVLNHIAERITISGTSGFVPADPNDDMIIDAALASGAKWIVTGDQHLLALDGFAGIRILTPQQFLKTHAV